MFHHLLHHLGFQGVLCVRRETKREDQRYFAYCHWRPRVPLWTVVTITTFNSSFTHSLYYYRLLSRNFHRVVFLLRWEAAMKLLKVRLYLFRSLLYIKNRVGGTHSKSTRRFKIQAQMNPFFLQYEYISWAFDGCPKQSRTFFSVFLMWFKGVFAFLLLLLRYYNCFRPISLWVSVFSWLVMIKSVHSSKGFKAFPPPPLSILSSE